jgi:hypothetical protein
MAGSKRGRPKFGGRRKGTPNRITAELKDMILAAFDEAGGVDYLVKQAHSNPTVFLALVAKVLPLQVRAEHDVGKRLAKALAWKPPT